MVEPGCNLGKPPLELEHFRLSPADKRSNKWASVCPACKEGILGVKRNFVTLKIERRDTCLLCGQIVIYVDVTEMWAKDWA